MMTTDPTPTRRRLPAEGSIGVDMLRALPEGAIVLTYGVGWGKTGPDEWRCPFRLQCDCRDSAWLAKVATMVLFDPSEWAL